MKTKEIGIKDIIAFFKSYPKMDESMLGDMD